MASDPARQRVLLFGGRSTTGQMVFDEVRGRMVLYGGNGASDTWSYGALVHARTQALGSPCAGSSGPSALTSNEPYLGNPAFARS
jgi:hypothetical protein